MYRKPINGQFIRQTKETSINKTWQWLQNGEIMETEGKIMCVKDPVLKTRYIQRAIDKTIIWSKCRR